MEDKGKTFWEKLAREVSNNATEEDKTWLREEQSQNSGNKTVADQAKKVWAGTALPEKEYEPDVEKGWQRLQMKAHARASNFEAQPQVRKMNLSTVYGIAASLPWLF